MRNPMGLRKGAWSEEEDFLLKKCIEKYGEGRWHQVPGRAGLNRCRKSCRLRWLNYLRPNLKRGEFEEDEVDLIIKLHNLLGNRWSLIAGRLPGRTANDIKNYWNTYLVKRVAPPTKLSKNNKTERVAPKINVIKPRPRTFTKGLSWMRGKATLVAYGGYNRPPISNNFDKPSASLPSSENETNWWEDLLADSDSNARINNALESDSEEELAAATRLFSHDLVAETDIGTSCKDDGPNASTNISFDEELWTFLEQDLGNSHSDDTIPLI